jgi:hypothetical protein
MAFGAKKTLQLIPITVHEGSVSIKAQHLNTFIK